MVVFLPRRHQDTKNMKNTESLFSLVGRTALVTGGTRGIGKAISLHFARAGAQVLANYVRNDEAAEKMKEEAASQKLDLQVCRADLTSRKGLDLLVERAERLGDSLSALIYCAATGVHRPAEQLEKRHLDWTFALNTHGFLLLTQRLLPRMGEGSSIVAVSSEGAVRTVPHYAAVGASKGALESMARHLAVELAPRDIRVNILSPGTVLTESWDAFPHKEERLEEARQRSPLKRLTSPEEVASAAHFLCCDASRGIVGHTLVVDGGKRIVG